MNSRCNLSRKVRTTNTRETKFSHYIVLTDSAETEPNYFNGLKNSLTEDRRNNISIKVISKVNTYELLERANEEMGRCTQLSNIWIVFDRDEVNAFDEIINMAKKDGIHVGWSNPCFEIWLEAYFGKMTFYNGSKACCSSFANLYKTKTGKEYKKNYKDIYKDLILYGDESNAIKIAQSKFVAAKEEYKIPSKMIPATSVFELVEEIIKFSRR